jgi:probable HAF family extracellular repeat protein
VSAIGSVVARVCAVFLILSCVVATPTAKPQPAYELIDLGTLGGLYSSGYDINERGDVTGVSSYAFPDYRRAFRYRNGTLEDISTLGSAPASSTPYQINKHGDVVGYSQADPAVYGGPVLHGFLYRNGETIDVTVDYGIVPMGLVLLGINDAGDMIGRLRPSADVPEGDPRLSHGVILIRKNGAIFDLGTMGAVASPGYLIHSVGLDINNYGEIVGQVLVNDEGRGFYYHSGQYEHITGPPICAANQSTGLARINDAGQMIGTCSIQGGSHAFLYDGTGHYTELGNLGIDSTSASGLNDWGDVVGSAPVACCDSPHAFVYEKDLGMRDLNTLIDADSGWLTLYSATAINNSGDITGYGRASSGEGHAFLLRRRR